MSWGPRGRRLPLAHGTPIHSSSCDWPTHPLFIRGATRGEAAGGVMCVMQRAVALGRSNGRRNPLIAALVLALALGLVLVRDCLHQLRQRRVHLRAKQPALRSSQPAPRGKQSE